MAEGIPGDVISLGDVTEGWVLPVCGGVPVGNHPDECHPGQLQREGEPTTAKGTTVISKCPL